jgi:YbbR domain-containing protein
MARHGELRGLRDGAELTDCLARFFEEIAPAAKPRSAKAFLRENFREKILAVTIATAMWIALGYRPAPTTREYRVPVEPVGLNNHMTVVRFEPETIEVVLHGSSVWMNLFNADDVRLQLRLTGLSAGEHEIPISPEDLRVPSGLEVKKIVPDQITVELEPREALSAPPAQK